MNMKKRICGFQRCAVVVSTVIVCASLFTPARTSAQNPGLGGAKTAPAIPIALYDVVSKKVTEYVVETGEIMRDLLLTGELKADHALVINAPRSQNNFNNSITYLADEGAIVRAGERIVEFDDTNLVNNRADAELDLETARLNVAKKKADLEQTRCDYLNSLSSAEASVKKASLYAKIDKSLLSENTYEKYKLDYQKALLQLEKARETLDNFEKNYDSEIALVNITQSQREIALRRIDSDIAQLKIDSRQDGIFIYGDNWQSNRKIQVGDSIFPGMEVASIPDLTSLQVIGYVFDTEYRLLRNGMRCEINFDALPGVTVGGSVVSLTDVAGRRGFATDKKMFQAVVRLDKVNPELLKPGMTARVNVPMVLAGGVPVAPREYIGIDSQGRNFVLKGTDVKKTDTQFVQIGAIGDSLIEITSGVSVGEKLFPVQ
jgi:multidrug efflux pump subunit AcrA (membrane-fusion protein)